MQGRLKTPAKTTKSLLAKQAKTPKIRNWKNSLRKGGGFPPPKRGKSLISKAKRGKSALTKKKKKVGTKKKVKKKTKKSTKIPLKKKKKKKKIVKKKKKIVEAKKRMSLTGSYIILPFFN